MHSLYRASMVFVPAVTCLYRDPLASSSNLCLMLRVLPQLRPMALGEEKTTGDYRFATSFAVCRAALLGTNAVVAIPEMTLVML